MIETLDLCNCEIAVFDQCQYGLRIPNKDGSLGLALKPTKMAGNLPHLSRLGKRCDHSHQHVAVLGGVKFQGRWQKRSTLAGAYPERLCQAVANIFEKSFQ